LVEFIKVYKWLKFESIFHDFDTKGFTFNV